MRRELFTRESHGRSPGLWRSALATAILLLSISRSVVQAQVLPEPQLKAGFLLNFTKFVEWPPSAFRTPQSPMTICFLGDDPVGRFLDDAIKGQSVEGRSLTVRRVSQVPRDDSCQVAYLGGADRGKAEQVLDNIKGLPILTVGESSTGSDSGSVIVLLKEDNQIRFNINLDTADRSGLKISARLLRLAKTVHEKKKN